MRILFIVEENILKNLIYLLSDSQNVLLNVFPKICVEFLFLFLFRHIDPFDRSG